MDARSSVESIESFLVHLSYKSSPRHAISPPLSHVMFHFPLLSPAHWRFSGDFEPLALAYIYRVFHVMMRASSFHRFKTIRHQWSSKNGNHQVNGQPIFPIPRAYRSEIIHCLHVCTCVRRHFLESESIWNTRRRREKDKPISRPLLKATALYELVLHSHWSAQKKVNKHAVWRGITWIKKHENESAYPVCDCVNRLPPPIEIGKENLLDCIC